MTDDFTGCSVCGAINEGGQTIEQLIQYQVDEIKAIFVEAEEQGQTVDITDIESNINEIVNLQNNEECDFKCGVCGNFSHQITVMRSDT